MTEPTEITCGVFATGGASFEFAYASVTKTGARKNDDAVLVHCTDDGLALLVADGATGVGFGDRASGALGRFFLDNLEAAADARNCKRFLSDADHAVRMACTAEGVEADTTGIVLSVSRSGVEGASVGDSRAIVFGGTTCELTCRQHRRPRIGNGGYPEEFRARMVEGDMLVVATDGLWNETDGDAVRHTVLEANRAEQAVAALLEGARNASGAYSDDVSVVCVRLA